MLITSYWISTLEISTARTLTLTKGRDINALVSTFGDLLTVLDISPFYFQFSRESFEYLFDLSLYTTNNSSNIALCMSPRTTGNDQNQSTHSHYSHIMYKYIYIYKVCKNNGNASDLDISKIHILTLELCPRSVLFSTRRTDYSSHTISPSCLYDRLEVY